MQARAAIEARMVERFTLLVQDGLESEAAQDFLRDRRIACRRRDGADCLRVGAPVAGPPLYL